MTNTEQKIILITGASSGIGESTAKALAKAGHTVVLAARRTERLETLATAIENDGGIARFYTLDVCSRENFTAVADACREEFGRIDVLINNAGLMPLSPMSALKIDEWEQMIDVNIRGVLNGIAAVLPDMEKSGQGHVVNIASIAAHAVFPTAAVYCGTKHAVHAISSGLRLESQAVRVTTISPGVVESELAHTTTDKASQEWLADFRKVALKPEAIARAIVYAIEQPRDVNVDEIIVQPTLATY
ncbi:putative oxidoreductase [Thalassocella blandensis]|nr:putative oxidoreductase [Thalassocella blandensis]